MNMKGDSEAPPAYDSIFSELKQKKEESGGLADYTKNASGVVKSKVGGACTTVLHALCLSACSFGLPIAEVVIGALHWDQCPAQRLLAVYLVVMGSISLVTGSFSIWTRSASKRAECEDNEGNSMSRAIHIVNRISGFASGFLFCWFIAGNVFIFQMKECDMTTFQTNTTTDCFTTDETYRSATQYCVKLLYDFVFWETIVRWILVGLVVVVVFTCCCVICCAYCCSKSSSKE